MKISRRSFLLRLLLASTLVGFLATALALGLKMLTADYEAVFFAKANAYPLLFFGFPLMALSVIAILRRTVFGRKPNKGITEIFETLDGRRNSLPVYKIPSHAVNGLLTVIFGGSTGVEVSTVVASATLGSVARDKEPWLRGHRTTLIQCGIAAGITGLFGSVLAGFFFCHEVISNKWNPMRLAAVALSLGTSTALLYLAGDGPLVPLQLHGWHTYALPWFVVLGILAGAQSVYLTRCVLFFKNAYGSVAHDGPRIVLSAAILGLLLWSVPQLYGEGYDALAENLLHANQMALSPALLVLLCALLIFKPIATSATLAAGGDGGVFAPSLFIGAFLGLLLALVLNQYLAAPIIPVNFMILGMAAMLSASIHAPLTAVFLGCALVGNYDLMLPAFLVCFTSKFVAKSLYPYTVYSYQSA